MSEEMKRLENEELDNVIGGKKSSRHGHRDSIDDCPPGTIEVKNEQLKNTHGYVEKCPYCGAKHNIERQSYYMVDTSTLVEGQYCNNCNKRWIAKG